ncbi:MAG: helix-turn-helix domain-containing protein [Aggregatilineales bacterium]
MKLLIPTITIRAVLSGLNALGFDAAELIAPTGLSITALENPFNAVPDEIFGQIWMQAFQQNPATDLPTRAGFAVPDGAFGLFDHLVESSATVGEALHTLNLFLWLVASRMRLEFTHDDGDQLWIRHETDEPTNAITDQWTLALCAQRFRRRMGAQVISQVYLTQQEAGAEAKFSAHFGVPVKLNHRQSGIKFLPGIWQSSIPVANPVLKQSLEAIAGQVEIQAFEHAPLHYVVRSRLPEAIRDQRFSVDDIASELGLSSRTLQRQLKAEDITFQQLLDLYRQEETMRLLHQGERSMATIAYSLGYNEQSSFNRAFRRWTGSSPSAWLRDARA